MEWKSTFPISASVIFLSKSQFDSETRTAGLLPQRADPGATPHPGEPARALQRCPGRRKSLAAPHDLRRCLTNPPGSRTRPQPRLTQPSKPSDYERKPLRAGSRLTERSGEPPTAPRQPTHLPVRMPDTEERSPRVRSPHSQSLPRPRLHRLPRPLPPPPPPLGTPFPRKRQGAGHGDRRSGGGGQAGRKATNKQSASARHGTARPGSAGQRRADRGRPPSPFLRRPPRRRRPPPPPLAGRREDGGGGVRMELPA
nr:basic proline-rich protein-like [Anser cygnoides]